MLRFLVALALRGAAPAGVSLATLAVNLSGSVAFGYLLARQAHTPVAANLYLGLTTGVLGGLTTYSTFNTELLHHALGQEWAKIALYAAATVVTCFAGGVGGWMLGRA